MQIVALGLIAAGAGIAASDPWSSSNGFNSVGLYVLGFLLLLSSLAPAAFVFRGSRPLLVLVELVAVVVMVFQFTTRFINPRMERLELPDAAQSVADARRLIAEYKEDKTFTPDELPPSLRFAHLRFAEVFNDHVTLVTSRTMDSFSGFRIWKGGATDRTHVDRPTQYANIFVYHYFRKRQESPSNIP